MAARTATIVPGVDAPVSRDQMSPGARKWRDFYEGVPGAPFVQREFGFYCLDEWRRQGLPDDANLAAEFGYDPGGKHSLGQLGWCEAAFVPAFESNVVEERGEYDVVQDTAGRHVLCFRGRRNGFMPEYLDHPVKDMATWEKHCLWRLDPESPERYANLEDRMQTARKAAAQGMIITQNLVGGYMYLRSLIGPEDTLYVVYDAPELVHACMRAWFELADAVIARHQQYVTIDELFLAEDICYNHGSLISPDMMREFLFPYYRQLISNLKQRQRDRNRHLFIQIDTDGFANPVIPVYREIGMDVMSPFEVAAGCDVVELGHQYPDLIMSGGVDKRVLARSRQAIDRMVDRIFPVMQARGGYCPTSDHGVPAEVPLENYRHYRKRCLEFA